MIGHQYDIIHPFSDAGMLAEELPNGRLLQASSLIELRVAPRRLTDEIAALHRRLLEAARRARARARVLIGSSGRYPHRAGMSSRQEEKERRQREREEKRAGREGLCGAPQAPAD